MLVLWVEQEPTLANLGGGPIYRRPTASLLFVSLPPWQKEEGKGQEDSGVWPLALAARIGKKACSTHLRTAPVLLTLGLKVSLLLLFL